MHVFYQPLIEDVFELNEDEAHHALRVLRLATGHHGLVTDGKGTLAEVVFERAEKNQCRCRVVRQLPVPPRHYHIHLAIAPTKNSDRMEWMVEKCVEIGVDRITFLQTQHSERKHVNDARLLKVAVSAMKQSVRAWLPVIEVGVEFDTVVNAAADQKFIAHVDEKNPTHLMQLAAPGQRYLALIGPEGDFSPEELSLAQSRGFSKVSLGPHRLRTETAGLVAVHTLHLAQHR